MLSDPSVMLNDPSVSLSDCGVILRDVSVIPRDASVMLSVPSVMLSDGGEGLGGEGRTVLFSEPQSPLHLVTLSPPPIAPRPPAR